MLVVSWLAIRTCLVFPHLAVTERFNWRLSWHAMAGKFWTALLIFVIAGTVFMLLGFALALPFEALGVLLRDNGGDWLIGAPRPTPPAGFTVVYKSLNAIMWGFTEVVWIALLSYVYREVIQAEQRKSEPPDTGAVADEPVVLDSKTWTG